MFSRSSKRASTAIEVPKFPTEHHFPVDTRDGVAWDAFWDGLLTSEQDMRFLRLDLANNQYRSYIQAFQKHSVRTILFAGNGISLLPYMFDYAGFDVLVTDISQAAMGYFRLHEPEEPYYHAFFLDVPLLAFGSRLALTPYPIRRTLAEANEVVSIHLPGSHPDSSRTTSEWELQEARSRLKQWDNPGGRIRTEVSDLFAADRGFSVDAVFLLNVAEHYSSSDREVLARRVYSWLRPGGMLIVESQYLALQDISGGIAFGIEEDFGKAGFVIHQESAQRWRVQQYGRSRWQRRLTPDEIDREFTQRALNESARNHERLESGAKVVFFHHGR